MAATRAEHFYYEEQPNDSLSNPASQKINQKTMTSNIEKPVEQVSSSTTERVVELSKNDDVELVVAVYGREYQAIVKELAKSVGQRNSSVIGKNWCAIRKVIDKNKNKFK